MDFNYFNTENVGYSGFLKAGASVQSGFGKCGHAPHVGEIFVINIYTDQTFSGFGGFPTSPIEITKEVP
jgi:hypothetical protein